MQLINKKNFMFFLAAVLVVAFGWMALSLSYRNKMQPEVKMFSNEIKKIETQSNSDDIKSIEKDLNETNLTGVDKELQDIDNELNQGY